MCLLILSPAGKRLPTAEEITRAWARNKDGGGFSFRDPDGTLTLCKGIFTLDSMLASMAEHLTVETEAVIHLRFSTHKGDRTKNCHPHRISDGHLGVCSHNGVINITHRKGESDTRSYIRQIITPLMKDAGGKLTPAMAAVIGRDIGAGNKLIVTPPIGESVIINEKSGTWWDGLWWSNGAAFPPAPTLRDWHTYTAPAATPRGSYAGWHADWAARQAATPDPRPSVGPSNLTCSQCGEAEPISEMRWRGSQPLCHDCGLTSWGKANGK
jgi:hypothetical protein